MFAQDGPALSNQNGTVVGILRDSAGTPASGVRVSALVRPEAINDLAAAASFAALGETDSAGQYRLENIPPGRYYIVAGRVDAPTYYPGTVKPSDGTLVSITPGVTASGIDFVLNNGSVGRANTELSGGQTWVIPIQTQIEGGGKIPLFAAGQFPVLSIMRSAGVRMDVPLSAYIVTLSQPITTPSNASAVSEYRVTVENLPETYVLKSLTFWSTDLRVDALHLPKGSGTSFVSQSIIVKLVVPPATPPAGVRVSGRIRGEAKRSIYISGNPGTIYSDGTFEFIGVPPGRHTIVTLDNPGADRTQGAAVVVGDRDLINIELDDISIAPQNSDQPTLPTPAKDRLPGSRSATASIRGRVLDADTHEPFTAGKVVINGNYSLTFPLKDDGSFDIPRLLPGKYVVDAVVYGIGIVGRTVVLDEQDQTIELTLGP